MRSRYRQFCATEATIPIFSRDWWLDATVGEHNWDVALVEKGGLILATMPYTLRRLLGFTVVGQPALAQTCGPWLRLRATTAAGRLAEEKDLLLTLLEQLPPYSRFSQNWHHSRTNWLPFYWNGFQQTTRYTYILSDLRDPEKIWKGLQGNIRTDIRKARERFGLTVHEEEDLDTFLKLFRHTFQRQKKRVPHSNSLIRRLDQACRQRRCRSCLVARDRSGRAYAGIYLVWDPCAAYYLLSGSHPELRHSGAGSLCLWEGIQRAAQVTKSFDFEGSMQEPIERFFRAFGARQTPYFRITRTPSRLLQMAEYLRLGGR